MIRIRRPPCRSIGPSSPVFGTGTWTTRSSWPIGTDCRTRARRRPGRVPGPAPLHSGLDGSEPWTAAAAPLAAAPPDSRSARRSLHRTRKMRLQGYSRIAEGIRVGADPGQDQRLAVGVVSDGIDAIQRHDATLPEIDDRKAAPGRIAANHGSVEPPVQAGRLQLEVKLVRP